MFSEYLSRILLLIWLVAGAHLAQGATLTVTSLQDSGSGTLRSAIDLAASGDTIDFQAGLSGVITLESPLPVLDQDLTLQGPGAGVITVSGNDLHRVFFVESGAVVVISGLTIADGFTDEPFGSTDETDGFGGGIFNRGNLTLEDSIVQDNIAEFGGGGLSNDGTLNLRRSTITGNSTDTDTNTIGGGIENFNGSVGIVQSTISGNLANSGGGIENFGGEVTLLFSTVAENSAASGSGVLNDGDFTAKNSLVADNPGGGDCADFGTSFDATGDNLDTDGTCPGFGQTTSAALALGSLADNGGPTATHALGETSVAVDAAADCTDVDGMTEIAEDQRGVVRPQGPACDIGAFELEQAAEPEILLDPDLVDFGEQALGLRSPAVTVEITNTGTADLVIGSLSIEGLNAGDFGFDGDICSGQTLAPNAACTFEVVFTPQEEGARQAQVSVLSNASGSPHQVDLVGTGSGEIIFADGFEGS